MKLIDLFERKVAYVYQNSEKTLSVISSLVEKNFGLDLKGGDCLVSQAIWSISALSKIPADKIVDSFGKGYLVGDHAIDRQGMTLQSIFDRFKDLVVNHRNKKYKFELDLETYDVDRCIKAITEGQPVTMIVNGFSDIVDSIIDMERGHYEGDGKIEPKAIANTTLNASEGQLFHALLLIGYDHAEKQIIGREINSKRAYKGYFKISATKLKKHPNAVKLIGIVVDSVKEVK